MENKNYKEEKFDSFLTKTIILSSKRYFKKEINTNRKEQIIFDDQNYSAFIQGFFDSQNPNFESTIDLSISVKEALKSLSAIEQSVIFLLFNEDLSQKEAEQILEIYSKTVSKIKIRAIDKLKKYFKNITKPKCSPKKGRPYWAKLFERFLKFILQQHCKFYFLHIFLLLLFFRLICLLLLHVQQFL